MPAVNLFQRTGAADFPLWLNCLVSGPPKSGKTTLLSTVPNLIILDTEPEANNMESVAHLNQPFVTITNTDDLRRVLTMLGDPALRKQVAAGYGWDEVGGVAIDTLDTLQKILKAERIRDMHRREFQRDDWGWLKTEMEQIVQAFNKLPMHTFFTVHLKSKEIGKGENAYQQVAVGLEGAISESIAGMVGYSMLSFRQPVLQADGSTKTQYFLRAEGDETYDFLGTRTGGRLPAVIEPDMAHIYNAVLEGRQQAIALNPPPPPMQPIEMDLPAQNPGQQAPAPIAGQVAGPGFPQQGQQQGPPQQQAPAPDATQPPTQQPGEQPKPADHEPVNAAALAFMGKMYNAMGLAFPEDKARALTIGQARAIAGYWRAAQQDHAEGKAPEGSTPVTVMSEILTSMNLMPDDGQVKEGLPAVQPNLNGSVPQVKAWVEENGENDLARVQEAYDKEMAKGENHRVSLKAWLESKGARPAQQVQPPVQTAPVMSTATGEAVVHQVPVPAPDQPAQVVTQQAPAVDPISTEDRAVQGTQQMLNAQIISQGVNPGAPCAECGKPHDDGDLAALALTRFQKVLCVEHYLAATRAAN